ncbi:hypothetical protein [Nocardia nepalensis]|uniref:restriction endonuclease subunit S n=1 Tax=Nocardia nepalensis TaxID=3375448 RepID=UPI003B674A9F
MDELAWNIEYGTSAKANVDRADNSVLVIRMGNIQDGRIVLDSVKYLDADHPDLDRLILVDGDLLFNRTNSAELVGKSAVYRDAVGVATFASYLIRCQLVPSVEPEWVSLVINSPMGRKYLRSVVSQQVGQANINGTKLARMPIPVPPVDTQREILGTVEAQLTASRRLTAEANRTLARAKSFRRALLDNAFMGRLVPQDPAEESVDSILKHIEGARDRQPSPLRSRRRSTAPSAAVGEVGYQEELAL